MTYVLVISSRGVNEQVVTSRDEQSLLDKVNRWAPDVRLGRAQWQDFGYKKAVVTERGVYEIFESLNSPATPVADYDPTDEEQGPLEQGWAESRRYDLEHKEDSDG